MEEEKTTEYGGRKKLRDVTFFEDYKEQKDKVSYLAINNRRGVLKPI